jgi:hypothetical protein
MRSSQEAKIRAVFPLKLAKEVQSQFSAFSRTDMTAFTFEKKKSDFREAKSDLSVFDGSGKLQLLGRDFGGRIFFWQPR